MVEGWSIGCELRLAKDSNDRAATSSVYVSLSSLHTLNVGNFCQLQYSWFANRWLIKGQTHTGIVISSQAYSVGEQLRRALKLIEIKSAEAMVDQLVFLIVFLSAYAVND